MPRVLWLGALLAVRSWAQAPAYTTSSIVNAATNAPGPLAPLALVSIYGTDLSRDTVAIVPEAIRNGLLPTTLPGSGVLVSIDNIAVPVLFVSPRQINFLIPGSIRPGTRKLRVALNGRHGPDAEIEIADASPGIFQTPGFQAIATTAAGSLITPESPAAPGDVVVIYATGLGVTSPAVTGLSVPQAAASIVARASFSVLLNGEPVPDANVLYAGVTPGFAGLYQVNCRLPETIPNDPEIRFRLPNQMSQPSLVLPVRTSVP
jgi:uncharacterized protein (TIGR03437 family)